MMAHLLSSQMEQERLKRVCLWGESRCDYCDQKRCTDCESNALAVGEKNRFRRAKRFRKVKV